MIRNMRDLGGLKAAGGRTVRPLRLIRSANLAEAAEEDLEGIGTVIDLRTPREREEAPDRLYGRCYLPLPLFEELKAGVSHEEGAENFGIPEMAGIYRALVNECAGAFRRVLTGIMENNFSRGAVLWHCTEGKDRCGITTALVLEMLGADRTAIMEDYLKTNVISLPRAAAIREQLAPARGEKIAKSVYRAYIADESYLEAAWAAMGRGYIRDRLGIGENEIRDFRNAVLE